MRHCAPLLILALSGCLSVHGQAPSMTTAPPPPGPMAAPAPPTPATPPAPPTPAPARGLEIKYVRDSAEYAALTREVYRMAGLAALQRAQSLRSGTAWAVVLDVDETTLDNSVFQLERGAYGLSYDEGAFVGWCRRGEAGAVPGVFSFISAVRRAGGHVAWITNRSSKLHEATQANLDRLGLWGADDRLCLAPPAGDTSKAPRRNDVITGKGECSWEGTPMTVVSFVGDQMGDFPQKGEGIPGAGDDEEFGREFFLLPNPMYGSWTGRITR